jgi:hypothetical protein
MRNRGPLIILLVAAVVATLASGTAPARADGYHPDNQTGYIPCIDLGNGSYWCDPTAGAGGTCSPDQMCLDNAVKSYNQACKICEKITDPVQQADCYFIANVNFSAALDECGSCPEFP